MPRPQARPLDGVTVVDLSRILAGPWATQMLADLGADVIKIERTGRGDDTRAWGPPYAKRPDGTEAEGQSAYFLCANRGKKSLAVDLKSEAGVDIVRRLATGSDVLVENFKRGDLARYGLDSETLRTVNPGLVYCSITGFGQTGPRAHQAGYDLLIQGMAGLMSITGTPDSEGGEPTKAGVALVDVLTGLNAVIGILAALRERDRTGVGAHIDLALYDVCAASLANQATNWLVGGMVPGRMGNAHPSIAPYQTFETADGHMILAVGNDTQFARLAEAVGRPDLASDPDYATNRARVANRTALISLLTEALRQETRAHWLAKLEPMGVPCGPINSVDEVFSDPQAEARELVRHLPHASAGKVAGVANPIRMDGASVTAASGPPTVGQHTRNILADRLGLSEADIDALGRDGVIETG